MDTETARHETWAPPAVPLTPDVIRLAATLIEQDDLALTHVGLSVSDALHAACVATGALFDHVEAVVASVSAMYAGGVEPGVTAETVVTELRRAAAAWEASPDGATHAEELAAAVRVPVLTEGVTAWAREWAGEHTPDETWQTWVSPSSHVSVAKGFPQSPHGGLGWRVRSVEWTDLTDAAGDAYDGDGVDAARVAVRARLAALVTAIQDSVLTYPPVEPVGIKEIAQRLGVERQSVQNWVTRTRSGSPSGTSIPQPRWTVGGRPVWCWHLDVVPWARATGRLTVGRGTWQQHTEAES